MFDRLTERQRLTIWLSGFGLIAGALLLAFLLWGIAHS